MKGFCGYFRLVANQNQRWRLKPANALSSHQIVLCCIPPYPRFLSTCFPQENITWHYKVESFSNILYLNEKLSSTGYCKFCSRESALLRFTGYIFFLLTRRLLFAQTPETTHGNNGFALNYRDYSFGNFLSVSISDVIIESGSSSIPQGGQLVTENLARLLSEGGYR